MKNIDQEIVQRDIDDYRQYKQASEERKKIQRKIIEE